MRCFDLSAKSPVSIYTQLPLGDSHIPEVTPQVDNLPATHSYQRHHYRNSKELDPLVCTLVCVSQLLFSSPQVFHFVNNLSSNGLRLPELNLQGLQFFGGLNGIPVSCICANVYVELNNAGRTIVLACKSWRC